MYIMKKIQKKNGIGKESYSGLKEIISFNNNICVIKKDGNNFINNKIVKQFNKDTILKFE